MNKFLIYIFTYFIFLCLYACGPACPVSDYSPLYKYRNYPLIRITNLGVVDYFGSYNTPNCIDISKKILMVKNGIISNSNYIIITNNQILYYTNNMYFKTICSFNNTNDVTILDANLKYICYIESNLFKIIDTNGRIKFSESLQGESEFHYFSAKLGNDDSDLVSYGIEINNNDENYYYGIDYMIYIRNIKNNEIITNFPGYIVIGFSPKNKYLFYNYFACDYFITHKGEENYYSNYNQGVIAIYSIEEKTNKIIGDYLYDNKHFIFAGGWSDCLVGISYDLKKIYIYEGPLVGWPLLPGYPTRVGDEGKAIDGRYWEDIVGLWKIDITQENLSE